MGEIFDLITSRRSVRRFTAEPIDDSTLKALLEAMRWAPSAGNAQPYRIAVIREKALKERLATAALGQRFISEAPVVIVVSVELDEAQRAYGTRGAELYCFQDTAAAIQNLLLLAHAKGIGSCWIGAFRERPVAEILALSGAQRPIAIIPLGVPAEIPSPPSRRALEELVRYL